LDEVLKAIKTGLVRVGQAENSRFKYNAHTYS